MKKALLLFIVLPALISGCRTPLDKVQVRGIMCQNPSVHHLRLLDGRFEPPKRYFIRTGGAANGITFLDHNKTEDNYWRILVSFDGDTYSVTQSGPPPGKWRWRKEGKTQAGPTKASSVRGDPRR